MITSALIRPFFVADTLRHPVIETTLARPVPHRVCSLVPSEPLAPLPKSLKPYSKTTATTSGIKVALLSYVRPMAVKYPKQHE